MEDWKMRRCGALLSGWSSPLKGPTADLSLSTTVEAANEVLRLRETFPRPASALCEAEIAAVTFMAPKGRGRGREGDSRVIWLGLGGGGEGDGA